MIWSMVIDGKPRPKGSLRCLGGAPGKRHVMREEVEQSTPWKLNMIRAIRKEFGIIPVKDGNRILGWVNWTPYDEAIEVEALFYFWPEVNWESHRVPFPTADDIGDTDKLCRNLGDALEQSGLIANDRLITDWVARKRWCEVGVGLGPRVEFTVRPASL